MPVTSGFICGKRSNQISPQTAAYWEHTNGDSPHLGSQQIKNYRLPKFYKFINIVGMSFIAISMQVPRGKIT